MKHCLIMTAYKDAAQINRIIGITPPEWGIYIHIDRKSALKAEDIDSRARVMKRYTIHWGAYAHLQAFLTLMEEARQSGAGYDYYHLVTGQDYYASRPDRFDELIEPGNYIYMETYPYPHPTNWWGDHYELVRIRSLAEYTDIRRPFGKMMELAYEWVQRITRTMQPVPPYPMYCGSVYLSLPADVVDWCLHSDIARDMQQRLKHCKIGEELYFQTVIMNSPFKERVSTQIYDSSSGTWLARPNFWWRAMPAPSHLLPLCSAARWTPAAVALCQMPSRRSGISLM